MLLFGFLLVPIILASSIELTNKSYIIELNGNILASIRATAEPSDDLNLSGLDIGSLDEKAFENVTHVKNLNLVNNSLSILPEFVLSYFESLEHLSLADNAIEYFHGTIFSHLKDLKSLNISNNPIKYLDKSDFFGLGNSTDILTLGSSLHSMNTILFQNLQEELLEDTFLETAAETGGMRSYKDLAHFNIWPDIQVLNSSLRVKLCLREGIVERLEACEKGERHGTCFKELRVNRNSRMVSLFRSRIFSFSAGWYRLQGHPILSLDLGYNRIHDVAKEVLNDLPEDLKYVSLADNNIERLIKGNIANEHLRLLNFKNNLISEIEDNAFANTNLSSLFLFRNRLSNTRFAATLPSNLTELYLNNNWINELSPDSFSRLTKLMCLYLSNNEIADIKSESLRGLSSLQILHLAGNKLKNIEPGSFQSLKALTYLSLSENSLTSLNKGVFDGLEVIKTIYLDSNKLRIITSDTFHGLPDTLQNLYLSSNHIESLETGSFINVPYSVLSLKNNNITKFEKGIFNFSPLKKLNKNGFFSLDISKNPVKRLENGALSGLPKLNNSTVIVKNVPIELIQGGVFDNL